MPIINSLLDTDLYKFTMMLFAHDLHPNVKVEYAFKCRTNVNILGLKEKIAREIFSFSCLKFTKDEVNYLIDNVDSRFTFLLQYIDKNLMDFDNDVEIYEYKGELHIRVHGLWWKTILYEVPVLSLVNELYGKRLSQDEYSALLSEGTSILKNKIDFFAKYPDIKIMEFGTRRRFSKEWQEIVLTNFLDGPNVSSTSNVKLAMDLGIPSSGTVAHEAFQVYQGVYHPIKSQVALLNDWMTFYKGNHAIALTDIFPQEKFLKDFDVSLAKAYKGVRHDSGDAIAWGDDFIDLYKNFDIDPMTKNLVFSDGLNPIRTVELFNYFKGRINTSFGIGTNLTNDMGSSHRALQVVMKIVTVDGMPVAKISNNIEKSMCEDLLYLACLNNLIRSDLKNA